MFSPLKISTPFTDLCVRFILKTTLFFYQAIISYQFQSFDTVFPVMFSLYYFLLNKGAFTQILMLSQIVIDHMKVVSKAYISKSCYWTLVELIVGVRAVETCCRWLPKLNISSSFTDEALSKGRVYYSVTKTCCRAVIVT